MDKSKAIEAAKRAVAFFRETNIVMTPDNYGVVYQFFMQENEKLNQYLKPYMMDGLVSEMVLKIAKKNHIDKEDGFLSKTLNVVKRIINSGQINNEEGLYSDLVSLKEELEEAREQSLADYLTGVGNRAKFEMEIDSLIENNEEFSMSMFDVDNFKNINDKFGHGMGDAVIRYLAKTAKSLIGKNDVIARIGGEEFAIISTSSYEELLEMSYDIKNSLENANLTTRETQKSIGSVTASFGVGRYDASKRMSKEEFYSLVDQAMYQSKREGKNRITECSLQDSSREAV